MKNIQDIFDLISTLFADNNGNFVKIVSEADVLRLLFTLEGSGEKNLFAQAIKDLIGDNLIKYEPGYGYSLTEMGKQELKRYRTFRLEISNGTIDDCADYLQWHNMLEKTDQIKNKYITCVSSSANPNASELISEIMNMFCLPYFKFDNSPIIPNEDVKGSNIYGEFEGGNIRISVLATNIESPLLIAAKKFDANVIICIADNEQDVTTVLRQYDLNDYKIVMFDDWSVGEGCLNDSELILQNVKKLINKLGNLIKCKEFKEFVITK